MWRHHLLLFLLAGYTVSGMAQDLLHSIDPDNIDTLSRQHFRSLDFQISEHDYESADSYNRRLLRRVVSAYIGETFSALGLSDMTGSLTSSAIGLAVGQGANLDFGKHGSSYLQLDDLDERERAIHYKFEYNW